MPQEQYFDIRIPDTGDEFEKLAQKVCACRFGESFERYGRTGQPQGGIDLFSRGFRICVQCKNYQGHNAVKRLLGSIANDFLSAVSKFGGSMRTYVLATTVQRDTAVQDLIAVLSRNYPAVDIQVLFWEDFQELLRQNPELITQKHSLSEAEKKLYVLEEALYAGLCKFRQYYIYEEVDAVNSALSEIFSIAKKLQFLGDRYRRSNPEITKRCEDLLVQYDVFIRACDKLNEATDVPDGSCDAQAQTMEAEYYRYLELIGVDKFTSQSEIEDQLHNALELLYDNLYKFPEPFNDWDIPATNTILSNIAHWVEQIYSLGQRYAQSFPEINKRCDDIADRYGLFAQALEPIATGSQDHSDSHTDTLLSVAEFYYAHLLDTVLEYLQ